MTQKDIVQALAGKLASGSTDQKRLIYNTIFNLKKRGTVQDDAGVIRLTQPA